MDEMTETIGKALLELNSRTSDASYGTESQTVRYPDTAQLPQEIVDFINHRRNEREMQRNVSVGVYG
jgi:hypothetical protein